MSDHRRRARVGDTVYYYVRRWFLNENDNEPKLYPFLAMVTATVSQGTLKHPDDDMSSPYVDLIVFPPASWSDTKKGAPFPLAQVSGSREPREGHWSWVVAE